MTKAIKYLLATILLTASAFAATVQGDCSGKTDSSAVLNAQFAHLTNGIILIPAGCQLRVDSQVIIQGQESFILKGESDRPVTLGGSAIFGCNGAAGAVLRINRSGWSGIDHLGIYASSPLCPAGSKFTKSVEIDNAGPGGYTTTELTFEKVAFTSSVGGAKVPSYVAVDVMGTPNTEHLTFRDNWINCQNSAWSYGLLVRGGNSDNDLAERNNISNCYIAIAQDGGNIRIVGNHFGDDGNYSVFGPGGSVIFVGYVTSGPLYIAYNEESEGGQFINSNNDQNYNIGGWQAGLNMIGNDIGISDMSPNAYPLNLGVSPVRYILFGNDIFVTQSGITKTTVGSSSQGNCAWGPLGRFIDIGNVNHFPQNTAGWSGCANGRDFQSGHAAY